MEIKYIAGLGLILATAASQSVSAKNPSVSAVEEYVYPANKAQNPEGFTYMPDGESYLVLASNGRSIIRHDIKTGKELEVYLDLGSTRETRIDDIDGFSISANASKILVWRNTEKVYRRSFTAEYYVYDIHSKILSKLSDNHARQQSALMSPDGRMVAFVADNNIYIKKLDYKTEVAVTDDGKRNEIINGISDWTYEEEFQTTCSMTWAPDNLTLAFLKYDESQVPMYNMLTFEGTCNRQSQYTLYPGAWSYKYPVAGQQNSKVTLHSYDVETRKVKDIVLPDNRIEYIPRIMYANNPESLIVATLNRDQNHYEIYCTNPKSTVSKSIYAEDSNTWINDEAYENMTISGNIISINSWKSGYKKIYLVTTAGSDAGCIESEGHDVTAYYGTDAQGIRYYQAAAPTPMDRTVYAVDRKGKVTALSEQSGTSSASFSPDMRYMMLSYNSTVKAPQYTLNTSAGKQLRVIEDNAAYAAKFAGKVAKREFFTFTTEDGISLNGYIIKPESVNGKLPVIMYQYSGPCSQEVLNRWQIDWQDAFAASGYCVVCVDGRGTGGRGREFCDIVYRRLGYYETIDQIAAAKYVATLPFVDSERIGIFGWSYGGYETLMCATETRAPYAAAVAVAPVTDWRFYDTVYAERFMQTPQQNEDGYRKSAPLERAARLQCPLLVMYGTSDDNVHPANSLQFVSELQNSGLLADMFVFPNMNHSINGCNARAVVYGKMLSWFNQNMK